jgi:hypothetical protein
MTNPMTSDSPLHDNQYMFPDGTIVDFGNRDPQEVLDAYVEWRDHANASVSRKLAPKAQSKSNKESKR